MFDEVVTYTTESGYLTTGFSVGLSTVTKISLVLAVPIRSFTPAITECEIGALLHTGWLFSVFVNPCATRGKTGVNVEGPFKSGQLLLKSCLVPQEGVQQQTCVHP